MTLAGRAVTLAFVRVGAVAPLAALDLGPRATDKRKGEHAAGRAAAHRALERLLGARAVRERGLVVVRTASGAHLGAPRVVDAGGVDAGVHVTISHHEGLAVAAAAATRLGVDLATPAPVEPGFVSEVFVAGELAAWRDAYGLDEERAVALAFAAKEAASKLLGVGFGLALLGFRVTPTSRHAARVDVLDGVAGCPAGVHEPRLRVRVCRQRVLVLLQAGANATSRP